MPIEPMPPGLNYLNGCDCEHCSAARNLVPQVQPQRTPAGMYAGPNDDPAVACQCSLCRAIRAGLDSPRTYDRYGFDQFGYNRDGADRYGYDHLDRYGYDADGYDADGYDRQGISADGCRRDGIDPGDLHLGTLWNEFPGYDRDAFRDHLRTLVYDPSDINELEFCGNCESPAWNDDLNSARGGNVRICDSCYDDWSTCDSCDERYPADDLYETLNGSDVCDNCRDDCYTWCEDCGGYYPDGDADGHIHDSADDSAYGSCCDSPQPGFTVRNDGNEPLAENTRVTITLPAGTISPEGLSAICTYLGYQDLYNLARDLSTLGDQWQTRDGNYPKRLSRHAYKTHQIKLTPDVMSQVGCIAREHSTQVSVSIEVTRDLNMSARDFYHEDSCWWGCYSESRCALKTNGGFGIRSFDSPRGRIVAGRAWVMPLRRDEYGNLVPTFSTMTPRAFVVFNGYGDLSGYAPARIVAHMAGWTYRKIGFRCDPMYINAGGYLIAPEDLAGKYTDRSLQLNVPQHANLYADENERELTNA